jgi:hypothetical protein
MYRLRIDFSATPLPEIQCNNDEFIMDALNVRAVGGGVVNVVGVARPSALWYFGEYGCAPNPAWVAAVSCLGYRLLMPPLPQLREWPLWW